MSDHPTYEKPSEAPAYCDHLWSAIRWTKPDGYRRCRKCGKRENARDFPTIRDSRI